MPVTGCAPGESRPRFTVEQWHEIGVRLMNRKASKGETFKDICEEFTQKFGRPVLELTLRRARKRMEKFKRLHGKPGPKKGEGGAPRYMTAAQCASVDDLTKQHQTDPWDFTALDLKHYMGAPAGPRGTWSRNAKLKGGTSELRTYNKDRMHERSYNRLFERLGIKAYAIENREQYTDAEKLTRKTFAQRHQNLTADEWEKYFFTDEHGVYFSRGRVAERQLRGRKLKCRHKKGEGQNPDLTRSKNGPNTRGGTRIKLHVTMCNGKTTYGKCGALLPSGKYTQHAWAKVIKTIGKFARKATNAQGFQRVKGIQDGMKAHWAPVSRAAMHENRVSFLANFPPRSPDLNPIENLFPHLDLHLARMQRLHGDAANEAAFMQRVDAFFQKPETEVLVCTLARSMPGRMQLCIQNEGAHTFHWLLQ